MNKYIIAGIAALLLVVVLIGGLGIWFVRGLTSQNANEEEPDLVETPPSVSTVNSLALADRPYVELIPHSNAARCDGVDLRISELKKGESKVEYELEYTTETLIQGVFGRRDFSDAGKEHDPLEFGTCSKGRCKCDDDITGGSLKLSFAGDEEYVLKGDFSVQNVGEEDGLIESRDVRLSMDVSGSLGPDENVLVASTFGIPDGMTDKVILGPYGVFVEDNPELDTPIKATLQSKDVANGKIQFWDGEKWQTLEAQN